MWFKVPGSRSRGLVHTCSRTRSFLPMMSSASLCNNHVVTTSVQLRVWESRAYGPTLYPDVASTKYYSAWTSPFPPSGKTGPHSLLISVIWWMGAQIAVRHHIWIVIQGKAF